MYCDDDRLWVHNVFVKRHEEKGMKLCIHHREFDPGIPITENIDKYMNKSWKVVVIMSNSFASSEWCQWELRRCTRTQAPTRKGCLCLNYAQSNWCWSYDKRHKNITKYNTIFALQKRNWGGTIFASCDKYSSTTTKCTTYVNLTLCWFKLVYVYGIKIENKTYRTVPKSNSKFVERCKINSLNTQIHYAPFSCSVQTLQ